MPTTRKWSEIIAELIPATSVALTFRGRAVTVTYPPGLRKERVITAGIHGLTSRLEYIHASESDYAADVARLVAEYGLTCRQIPHDDDSIEFAISSQ